MGIFNPGRGAISKGKKLAKRAEFTGGNVFGPGGMSAGLSFGPNGAVNSTMGLGDFEPIMQMLLGQAQQQGGVPAELQSDFQGFGQAFQQALGRASADPFATASMITDKLRPGLDRAQGNLRNETFSKLFGSGQAAISGAASPVLEGLQQQFGEQQQALDVTGMQMGQSFQNDAFNQMMGASGNRQQIAGMGQQQQMQSLGAAQNLSQLPLAFQQALMAAGGMRTDSLLGASSQFMNAGASAVSPLLEGLTAAGGFMTGLGALKQD